MSDVLAEPGAASAAARNSEPSRFHWGALPLLVGLLATWMLVHAYLGIRQDAVLYAMQGLAHAHPGQWMQDIYLRYGSQDNFSIFAALYARVILWMGLEPAAKLLTLLAQLGFYFAAWRLARRMLPPRLVVIGLGLLITLRGVYGASGIFCIAEDLLTPRLPAEALVLCALLSWLREQRLLAAACLVLALSLHPIMGLAGAILCFWLTIGFARPRLAAVLVGAGALALILIGLSASGPPLRFDDLWFSIGPARVPFVLVGRWTASDWAANLVPLTTLAIGCVIVESQPQRRLLGAALATGLSGLALAWLGGDLMHLVLVIQGQPWRWLWLSTVFATLMLPLIMMLLWQRGRLGRATAALLLADYLLMRESYALPLVLLTFAVLMLCQFGGQRTAARAQRLVLGGALLVLAIAVIVETADFYINARLGYFPNQAYLMPLWMKELREASQYILLVPLLFIGFAWLAQRQKRRGPLLALTALGLVLIAAQAPAVLAQWNHMNFTEADKAEFAPWRARIPAGANVLYTPNPLLQWILLERPSYISDVQTASVLFSRPAAMAILDRVVPLTDFLVAEDVTHINSELTSTEAEPTLATICASTEVQFVVTHNDLQATPIEEIPSSFHRPYGGLKLYKCQRPQA
jgi:hypothetical protein